MEDNPYRPPKQLLVPTPRREDSIPGRICFALAVIFTALGFLANFMRNSPSLGWLLLGVLCFIVAYILRARRYRRRSLVGLVLCLITIGGTTFVHVQRIQRAQQQQMMELRVSMQKK